MLAADMAAARALGTDIIAVSIHWGAEYHDGAERHSGAGGGLSFFEQGADLVIGGHPHVPQPMELQGDSQRRRHDAHGLPLLLPR